MANRINAEPTEAKKTHYVSFEQGSTKLGLVLCNGRGEPDSRAMQQGKMPTRALQFSQGDPDYSDMELPYTPITQKDWSGGRGQEDFEKDKTRYSDSQNIDAMYGDVILGPKATSIVFPSSPTSITNAQQDSERIPNPFTNNVWSGDLNPTIPELEWEEVSRYLKLEQVVYQAVTYDGRVSKQTRATRFQWTSANNLNLINLWLAKTNNVSIVIFKYPTVPGTLDVDDKKALAKAAVNATNNSGEGITGAVKQDFIIAENDVLTEYQFNFPYTMVQNEYYVLAVTSNKVLYYPQASRFELPFLVGTNNTPSSLEIFNLDGYIMHSTDEINWNDGYRKKWYSSIKVSSGDSLAFSLVPVESSPGSARFFNLRNTKFLITSPLDGGAPKLYMEGYHGFSDGSNSADKTKLLARNIGSGAVGCIVKIVGGTGATELVRWRKIQTVVTGAAGYVTVDPPWNITHDDTTEYAIYGTETWTEITNHGLTKPVTDVAVHNDIVYFAMGDAAYIMRTKPLTTAATPDTWSLKTPFWPKHPMRHFLKSYKTKKVLKKYGVPMQPHQLYPVPQLQPGMIRMQSFHGVRILSVVILLIVSMGWLPMAHRVFHSC